MRPTKPTPDATGFDGRTALVIGGSRGLGRAVAVALAEAGTRVLAVGRAAAPLAELRAEARARALPIRTARGDASRRERARALVRLAGGRAPAPDLLVVAAGDYWEGPFDALDEAALALLVRSNLATPIVAMQAALPGMRRRRFGRILLFGVAGGDAPRAAPHAHAYRAVKTALLTLARSVAQAEAAAGITVNVILPGLIGTPGLPRRLRALASSVPARRLGTEREVARAALFLLAEESGYVTGTALHVSGGYLL
ncbi:MAG: SDR family NAD(P)-dependent oxidoreductase [Hyphomicrobiales bacterium]